MKAREFDPQRLDVQEFARAGAQLSGQWPLASMQRLAASQHEQASAEGRHVEWSVTGARVERVGAEPQTWLHLEASTCVALECQRCLGPVDGRVSVERSFRFVPGESQAEELDADSEEDVLAITRSFDLQELVEDELILALPLVPRHQVCPQPLQAPEADELPASTPERPNPFAVLAQLKKGGGRAS